MLNSIGLENVGLEGASRSDKLPRLTRAADRDRGLGRRRDRAASWCAWCARWREPRRSPDTRSTSRARTWRRAARATGPMRAGSSRTIAEAARAHAGGRLIAKLSPERRPIRAALARACEAGGADAVIARQHVRRHGDRPRAPRIPARARDRRAVGPGDQAARAGAVHEVAGAVRIPVVGIGRDRQRHATRSSSSSPARPACRSAPRASSRPDAPVRVALGDAAWCNARGVARIADLVRTVRVHGERKGGDAWT